MRKYLQILLVLIAQFTFAKNSELLSEAEKAYDSKKYKEAIAAYEKLLAGGVKSWQVYYNLGNCYYRDKQLGKAIYNYELARKFNPNDEDVKINLGISSAKTIDKIDSKENFFITAVKTNVLLSLETSGWAWLTVIFMFLFCSCIFIFISSSGISVKRTMFFLGTVFLIVFATTYFLGYSALRSKHDNKFAIIVASESKVMNEPTATANSKFSLHEGTKVRIVESNGDWVLIKLDNGNEGWLKLTEVGVI